MLPLISALVVTLFFVGTRVRERGLRQLAARDVMDDVRAGFGLVYVCLKVFLLDSAGIFD